MYETLDTIQNILVIVVWGNIFYTFYATIKDWNHGEKFKKHLNGGCIVGLMVLFITLVKYLVK